MTDAYKEPALPSEPQLHVAMSETLTSQEWAEIADAMNEAAKSRECLSGLRDKVRAVATQKAGCDTPRDAIIFDKEAYLLLHKFYGKDAGGLMERILRSEKEKAMSETKND